MKKILLIEDNEDHAELIKHALEQNAAIEICLVNRIQKAMQELKTQAYDLILSDYYIPDSPGENYIQNLSSLAPLTPIVIISGKGDEETAAKSIQAGAEDYIVKTREALQVLPQILKRVWTKHQRNLRQRKKELKQHKEDQQSLVKEILEEFIQLENQLQEASQTIKENMLMIQVKDIHAKLEKLVHTLVRTP